MTGKNFNALKRFGQNFLVDRNILADMISRSCITENDNVLEIGPGHGILTRALLSKNVNSLHVIELDARLKPELDELSSRAENLHVHWGDAVKFDYASLTPFPNKIVANIPYNITTPLIWKLLSYAKDGLTYHLYMLQREAALRITAPADTKARYPLGIMIEAMGKAIIVKNVGRECFRPVPDVNSCIVEIVTEKNFELACNPLWSELLHCAFAHRRKTLLNNLRGFRNINDWGKTLGSSGIDGNMRAEDLECEQWLNLYHVISQLLP